VFAPSSGRLCLRGQRPRTANKSADEPHAVHELYLDCEQLRLSADLSLWLLARLGLLGGSSQHDIQLGGCRRQRELYAVVPELWALQPLANRNVALLLRNVCTNVTSDGCNERSRGERRKSNAFINRKTRGYPPSPKNAS